jgi:NADPH:quinone reductase-like Zn-dependent oxidoreductase
MKAAMCIAYGDLTDAVRIVDVPPPVPAAGEVLVDIRAASLNISDLAMLRGRPLAIRLMTGWKRPKPTIMGRDFAGVIMAVGAGVSDFEEGQAVFGVCKGTCAEYACAATFRLAHKPAELTFEQAATVPVAGITALQGLRDIGRLSEGDRVLITGASSGVGTFAVQIAKALGGHVTAVCGRTSLDAVRSLGPHTLINRDEEDYAARGDRYDLFFDLAGDRSLGVCRQLLTSRGRYVGAGVLAIQDSIIGVLSRVASLWARSRVGKQPLSMYMARVKPNDLATLAALAAGGQVRPLIDRTFPLDRAGEAYAYLEARHTHGKLAVRIA